MLELIDVHMYYGKRRLLDGVSLRLHPGEMLVIVGVNGAGKSTLLKLMAGDLPPTRGMVALDGQPLKAFALPELARRRAVVPQDSRLMFPLTALDVVLLGRHAHHRGYPSASDRRIARETLERLDALHLEQRLYPTLSGGERARVQLSRALGQLLESGVEAAPVLLLDEPTASLDLAHQHTALAAARDFARSQHAAVCAVLHDLNLAAQYADRIALMAEGQVIACGRPAEVLTGPLLTRVFRAELLIANHPMLDVPWVVGLPRQAAHLAESGLANMTASR